MLKHWISAFRLRTLPLALSTILMGNALAALHNHFDIKIFMLSIFVTVSLQILSNLANDYGDGVKGTDNSNRIGPERAIQSGIISQRAMKIAIIFFSILSFILGIWLVFTALSDSIIVIVFILLGLAAIGSAIKYTIGKNAYGYVGLGDLFVFIFFGIIGVIGSFYLQTQSFTITSILPAIAVGCFSTAVLNLNNMRDIENDKVSDKKTLVVMLGLDRAKKYHTLLFVLAYASFTSYLISLSDTDLKLKLSLITGIIFLIHLRHLQTIRRAKNYNAFDPQLKIIALTSFGLSLGWFVTINWF